MSPATAGHAPAPAPTSPSRRAGSSARPALWPTIHPKEGDPVDPSSHSPRTTIGSPVVDAGTPTTDASVVLHVLSKGQVDDHLGTFLLAHPSGSETDWTQCGTTTMDVQCRAVSQDASKRSGLTIRCPKRSAVQLPLRSLGDIVMLPLCGGHFMVHRSGKNLELAL